MNLTATQLRLALALPLFVLLAAGCSSTPKYYEMTLKQPNPYNAPLVRSADKPQLDKQNNYRITDGMGGIHIVPRVYVADIKAKEVQNPKEASSRKRYYEVALIVPNPYNVPAVRSADKPQLDKNKNYTITDGEGGTFLVQSQYVMSIQSREAKRTEAPRRVDNQPGTRAKPNYINPFDYR